MHPVITYLRHKGIAAVLAAGRLLHRATGGRRPKFLFSANAEAEYVGSDVKIVSEDETSVTIAKFRPDGTIDPGEFRILTATDLHLDTKSTLTRGGASADRNNKSVRMLVREIKRLRPDLVIFTGDVNQSDFQQIDAVQISLLMEKLGVYWAYAFGNHEAREEKGYYKYLMYKGFQYGPHCLCRFGDPALFGYGNFAIHIKNSENTLAKSLYLFDSGRDIRPERCASYGLPEDQRGYDFLKREQIGWYLGEVEKTKKTYGEFRTVAYMHIPLPEYQNVFDGDEENGYVPSGRAELLYGTQY
ncbi:MAG: metallophosphoesterase, partial [Clostridia bacterium]|nr:metallophosphoesterase [Clostridia bacterium]